MSRPARPADPPRRGAARSLVTFLFGVPLGVGLLMLIGPDGPLDHPLAIRYTEHPVEWAEVVMFFCAVGGLLGKLLASLRERAACGRDLLGPWDGKPVPTADAAVLRQALDRHPPRWRDSFLGRRLAAVLDFVRHRGTADGLDDQLRTLADNDVMALDGSYSLLRFINWAIPILGFLGTVLGITDAIHGVTPEVLEQSLDQVTGGLATAFDTTALALLLTMILMFFTFVVERLENGVLETVDHLVDAELAHRFVRAAGEGGGFVQALTVNTQAVLAMSHELVEKQVSLWAGTLDKAEQHWTQAGIEQQTRLTATLQHALEYALSRYGQRLADMEQTVLARQQAIVDGLTSLSAALTQTGQEHQLALARLTDSIGLQVEALGNLQVSEHQLVRLQESLNQNLTVLASAETFEQAVQSLTAAIHLLTTRVATPTATTPRVFPREAA